ncbi:type II toxin-antitoxin system VapC family toxin [Microbacterium sp. ASV49]|uniref:Ribonuclease VapC n=1 Tax=Microbacterium candidum TaxID=3041922 RepID=A0ABT7MX35_9MICO|nr:PIN domain-containing protein [Microbacterium sp. ASV49]MDL9979014.1 PIN domain-containing protein [Microbacterium sp. ASV49]
MAGVSSATGSQIVFDAGVLIAIFDEGDAHSEWARRVYRDSTSARLLASALTVSESIVHAARDGKALAGHDSVRALDIDVVPLIEGDVVPLAELRARSRLRMPDAVVLHTAIRERAAIATTDARLARIAREHGVEACAPDDENGPLDVAYEGG